MNELALTGSVDATAGLGPQCRAAADGRPRGAAACGGCGTASRERSCGKLLTTARLRTVLVVGLSLFFWIGLFLLFYEGFRFIVDNVGEPGGNYHAQTVRFVFHLFFASLNVMLVFSSGIILYTGLLQLAGDAVIC